MAIITGVGNVGASQAAQNHNQDLVVFTPVETFEEVVGGEPTTYCEGMTYRVRPGNHELSLLVGEWINSGKVKRID